MKGISKIILAIGILSPLLLPLLQPGTPFEFDMRLHLERIAAFYRALQEGFVPPSWSTYLAWGYGSPVLIFNWSLPYYFASAFIAAGSTLVDSYKWITALSYIAAFGMMYLLLSALVPDIAAFVGAVWYVWVPYRFNINQLRGAIGEEFAWIFWPGIFWSAIATFKRNYYHGFLWGAVFWALLIWSHTPLFGMITPVWLIFVLLKSVQTQNTKAAFVTFSSLILGMALVAFSWIPILFERHLLQYNVHEAIFRNNFLAWQQIWLQQGIVDFGIPTYFRFYAIGWPVIGIATLSAVTIIRTIRRPNRYTTYLVFFLLVGLTGLIFLTKSSAPFWENLPLLAPTVNYPQRFLALVGFSASILTAFFIASVPDRLKTRVAILLSLAIITSSFPFLSLNSIQVGNLDNLNHPELTTTDVWGEFRPKQTPADFSERHNEYATAPLIAVYPTPVRAPSCVQNSVSVTCSVETMVPSVIDIRQFNFPGWKATADGKPVPIIPGPNGIIRIDLPIATGSVKIVYSGTTLEKLSRMLSLVSLIIFMFFYAKTTYTQFKRQHETSTI